MKKRHILEDWKRPIECSAQPKQLNFPCDGNLCKRKPEYQVIEDPVLEGGILHLRERERRVQLEGARPKQWRAGNMLPPVVAASVKSNCFYFQQRCNQSCFLSSSPVSFVFVFSLLDCISSNCNGFYGAVCSHLMSVGMALYCCISRYKTRCNLVQL